MSSRGSQDLSIMNTGSVARYMQMDDDAEGTLSPGTNVNVEFDVDIRTGDGSGGGHGKKKSNLTLEQRARVLSPGDTSQGQQTTGTSAATARLQVMSPQPTPPYTVQPQVRPVAEGVSQPAPRQTESFVIANASILPGNALAPLDPNDPWLKAGSLKQLENEQVLLRKAGQLTDVLNAYRLISIVMLTSRRVVIKQSSAFLGLNLSTVESSFLYENLHHIGVERVTNFRMLWGGSTAVLLAIIFWALSGVALAYPLLGVVFFLGGLFAIYWFFIFYNSNSVVIDFSKSDLVGSWLIPKGKGACITKRLILHIDHCFEVMYGIYDQAKTVYADNNA